MQSPLASERGVRAHNAWVPAQCMSFVRPCHNAERTLRLRTCVVTPAVSSRSQLLGLTQWAISKGIKYAKVRPVQQDDERGMYATFDISKGYGQCCKCSNMLPYMKAVEHMTVHLCL